MAQADRSLPWSLPWSLHR